MSRLDAVIETVHPEDAAQFQGHPQPVPRHGRELRVAVSPAPRRRRLSLDVEPRGAAARSRTEHIVQWYGLCHDIDDQMHAEEALRQSEQQLQQMIDTVPAIIWCTTPEGIPCYLNKRATDVIGVTLKDLIAPDGSRSLTLIHPDDRDAVDQALARSFETGTSFEASYRQRRSTGPHRWVESRAEPLRDDSGKIIQWYGVSVDIDDMVTAQEALHDRERELSLLVDMIPALVARQTPSGEMTFTNKRLIDFLGVDLAHMDASNMSRLAAIIKSLVHPDDATRVSETARQGFATGESFSNRYRLRRADGMYRWMEGRAEPLRNQSGEIAQWYAISVDIDDEMRAQEALRNREQELSQLVDMVPVHIRRMTPEGEPIFFNKRLIDFFGLGDLADLDKPGMSRLAAAIQTLVHPDDADRLLETARHSFATGEPFSMKYRMRRADGVYRWVDGRGEPLRDQSGAILQWYVISIDIDDEMRAQEALRERERELSQLVDMVPSLLWRLSPEGEPTFFSKRLIEFCGLDVGDFDKPDTTRLAAAMATIFHPDDTSQAGGSAQPLACHRRELCFKYRLRRADGVYRWMSGRAEPLRDESGRIVQWYGLSHDIDDQVRVEEALRERERFLWQLVETLPAMIDCAAHNGEPIYRSRQLREFLGYELEDLDGTGKSRLTGTLDAGVHPDDLAGVKENYAHSLSTGEPYGRRHRLRRFDGEYRWVETRAAPMRNDEGTIVQWNVICLDIEGEVRAQEELRLARESLARASQAASLAELSAAIAHEVNQPLAAIVANSNACQRWLSAAPPNLERAQKTVERIIHNANAAADVVSHIRALFKHSVRRGRARRSTASSPRRTPSWPRRRRGGAFV